MFVHDEFDNDEFAPAPEMLLLKKPPAPEILLQHQQQQLLELGRGKRKKCATLRTCPCACGGDKLLHDEAVAAVRKIIVNKVLLF